MSKFRDTGLIPTADLAAGYEIEAGVTGNDVIYDFSGNSRHTTVADTFPSVQANVLNHQPAMYWDGTKKPLSYSGTTNVQHIFIVAAYDGAAFAGFEGLLSDLSVFGLLVGGGAALTKFYIFDPSIEPDTEYKKNDTVYANTNLQAPMGLSNVALLEIKLDNPLALNGIRFGQDRADTTRKWKGWLFGGLFYSAQKTATEIAKIHLLYNIQFGLWRNGLPFRFPDPDLTGIRYRHFDDKPKNYDDITDSFTFEDNTKTFWETAEPENVAKFWDLEFDLAYQTHTEMKAKLTIFDEFWNQARLVNPFTFVDKYGVSHENVRIADYSRAHEAHRSWRKDVKFRLVQYPE